MKKNEVEKVKKAIVNAKGLNDLKEVISQTKELNGIPAVAIKIDVLKQNMIKVLDGEITVKELQDQKAAALAKGREKAKEGSTKDQPKVKTEKKGKEDKTEKKGKETGSLIDLFKELEEDKEGIVEFIEDHDLPIETDQKRKVLFASVLEYLTKQEKKAKDQPKNKTEKKGKDQPVKEDKEAKKTKKLLAHLEEIKTDKDELKAFKKENGLKVETKGLKAKEIYKALLLLLTGNTTKQTEKGRTIAEPRPMVETIAKVDGKKAYVVKRPDTVRGFITQLLLDAKKEGSPISFEDLYKKVCNFEKVSKEDRKRMFKEKSGLYTTCRVTPTNIGQTEFHVTIKGSGDDRTFIAS